MIWNILFFIGYTAIVVIILTSIIGKQNRKLIEIIESQNKTLERNRRISEHNEKNYIANEERYSLRCKQIDVLTETIDVLNKELRDRNGN